MPRRNLLLASLSEGDAAAIRPHLVSVHLDHKKILFEAGDPIRHVYFPEGAIISLVVGLSTGEMVEAAMVGKDGVVGASSALDGKISSVALLCNSPETVSFATWTRSRALHCKVTLSYRGSFAMNRQSIRRPSNRPLAWLLMTLRLGSAAGYSVRGIYQAATPCSLPKSSLRRCSECGAPA